MCVSHRIASHKVELGDNMYRLEAVSLQAAPQIFGPVSAPSLSSLGKAVAAGSPKKALILGAPTSSHVIEAI